MEVFVLIVPPFWNDSPVFRTARFAPTWLDEAPLNRLFARTPSNVNVLLESLCPFAQMFWFPNPVFVPVSARKSALTPGLRVANCVKLPVPSGRDEIWLLSRTYPFVVSTVFRRGVADTCT